MCAKWIIAVSGGPDSMALLDLMNKKGYDCIVAHVNYHKRESSDRDETIVRNYANKHNLHFEVFHDYGELKAGNFQDYARKIRYDFFEELVSKYNAKGVVVAHHKDDDVETWVMQKIGNRKSHAKGLNEFSMYENIVVWRPLLNYRKQECIVYCNTNGVEYGLDESNEKPIYTRNRIRLSLQELNEERYNELYLDLVKEKEAWEINQQKIKETVLQMGPEVLSSQLESMDVLREWLISHRVPIFNASTKHLEEMFDALKRNKGYFKFDEIIVYGQYNKIYIHKLVPTYDVIENLEDFVNRKTTTYEIRNYGEKIESLHITQDDFPLTVRNPKDGDSIQLRMGTKSIHRHFIDRKIPMVMRKNWLVIENSSQEIVFAVGIGCDIHHYSNNSDFFMIKL